MKIKVGKNSINKIKEKIEIDFPVYVSIENNNYYKNYYKIIDLCNNIEISTYNDSKNNEVKYSCNIDINLYENRESPSLGLSTDEILINSLILKSEDYNILTASEFNKHYTNYKKSLEKWL